MSQSRRAVDQLSKFLFHILRCIVACIYVWTYNCLSVYLHIMACDNICGFCLCIIDSLVFHLRLEISVCQCVEEGRSDEKARGDASKEFEALRAKV